MQTRERNDTSEAIDIVFACKRSRFRDAAFIHLYNKRIKQKKEKITIKRMNILKKGEERILTALTDATKIIKIEATTSELAESKTNCNILNILELIFERLRINAKRNGTAITFIVEKIIFVVLYI